MIHNSRQALADFEDAHSSPAKSHGISVSLHWEREHDLHVSRKCYKISRNLGNLSNLIFFCKKACFWCESDRVKFWCESEKCWSQGLEIVVLTAPERRLRRDFVCINSVFGSPEDGATCGIGSVQCRHHVTMRATTLVDQDSRNFTCSTWQLWHSN